jgi:predicted NBD/HSP70 family sugar kinase
MRLYTQQHAYYFGIDLHARTMYMCILDQAGGIVLHRNMRADPESFLKAIAAFRQTLWWRSNASSRGIGWRICAPVWGLLLF